MKLVAVLLLPSDSALGLKQFLPLCDQQEKNAIQFSSVANSCLTLCNPMNRSTPGLPVHHQRLEFTQTHVR